MTKFIIFFGIFSLLLGLFTVTILGNRIRFSKETMAGILTGASAIIIFETITNYLIFKYRPTKTLETIHRILAHISVLLFYLAIFSIGLSIFFGIAYITNLSINTELLSKTSIITAIIFSIIGIIQSYALKSTYFTVRKIIGEENLRIALTSDQHFGVINQILLAKHLIKKLLFEKPDFIIIAGDLFDGPLFNIKIIEPFLRKLSSIAPVIYTPGNHEELGNYNLFIETVKKSGIHVLDNDFITINGITFGGYDYRTVDSPNFISIADTDKSLIKDAYMIIHKPAYQKLKIISQLGARFIFSGHTHNGQMFPIDIPVAFVYGKFMYGMNKIKNTITFTTSGVGTARMPVRLFNTPEVMIIDIV